MRIMSLDVGFRKVGVALSGVDQNIIFPLPKIVLSKFNGRVFFEELRKSLDGYWDEVEGVVVGNGQDSEYENNVTKAVDQVARVLRSWTNFNVMLVPETNSSVESRSFLREIGFGKNKVRDNIDSYAALLLLKEYFDSIDRKVLVSF